MAVSIAAEAQDLKKEITIEKEIVPELRAATRLNVNHAIISPSVKKNEISFSDRDIAVDIVPGMVRLDPASTFAAVTRSPWRGYASLGYFPAYNLGLSAGYNIVQNKSTVLNVWGQFDGFNYKTDTRFNEEKLKVTDNTGMMGVGLSHYFNEAQSLSLNAGFGFTSVKYPGIAPAVMFSNDFNGLYRSGNTRFNIDGRWRSGDRANNYTIGLDVSMFSNSAKDSEFGYGVVVNGLNPPSAVREMNYAVDFGIKYGALAIDVDASFLNYNAMNRVVLGDVVITPPWSSASSETAEMYSVVKGSGKTNGVVSARPHFIFDGDMFQASVGASLQYTVNSGKNFHIAPDVRLSVIPSSKFSAYACFGGGEHQNTLMSLFNESHFISPLLAYENSHIPFTANIGLTVGPFSGASLELFGGYAIANDWLMPAMSKGGFFMPIDMKGWYGGARLRYKYRDIVDFSASFEAAPQKEDRGYYLWRDRAEQVVKFDLSVRPVDKLMVEAAWELRGDRQIYHYLPSAERGVESVPVDLSSMSNLSLRASYDFTDAFSVFARGENLLNKKWFDITGVQMQGLTGLVGVSYKF